VKLELKEIVAQLVEEVLDEAIRRQDYVEGLINAAKGAMGEHFKARYAEANVAKRVKAGPGTAQGWDREAEDRLAFNFADAADRKFKGNPSMAFDEAVEELRRAVPRYLMWAKKEVAKDFQIDIDQMDDPDDASTDEFFAKLHNVYYGT